MRRFPVALLALAACELPRDPAHAPGWVIDGSLPADVDLDEVAERIPPGGFAVLADPRTGEVATVTSVDSPLARVASGDFTVQVAASCPDCIDPSCASTSRTIEIGLRQTGGAAGGDYTVQTTSVTNFTSFATSPAVWSSDPGDVTVLSTTGNLSTCSTFGHFFDVVGPMKRVFASASVPATFGGALAGDAVCQAEADTNGLGGTWKAWVADSVSHPMDRFSGTGPWARLGDGAVVALDVDDLMDGGLQSPILVGVDGVPTNGVVWTGLDAFGVPTGLTCSDWTSSFYGSGTAGDITRSDGAWVDVFDLDCFFFARLACFQQ